MSFALTETLPHPYDGEPFTEPVAGKPALWVPAEAIKPEDQESVLAALRVREEAMSTGIGFGIAIPHASSDRITEVVAAFGRSEEGIDFDALDGEPVKLIVLFLVPTGQFQTHLRTLAAIAKFLNDGTIRDRLKTAADAKEILSIFEATAIAK